MAKIYKHLTTQERAVAMLHVHATMWSIREG
jgi:hypothetical protein